MNSGGEIMEEQIKLYTINEVAEMLRITRVSVYKLINSGKIKSVKVLSRNRFTETEINNYLHKEV